MHLMSCIEKRSTFQPEESMAETVKINKNFDSGRINELTENLLRVKETEIIYRYTIKHSKGFDSFLDISPRSFFILGQRLHLTITTTKYLNECLYLE